MSFRPYIIEVKGDVVAKEGCHYAQDWVAMSASEFCDKIGLYEYVYDKDSHSVNGDLILSLKLRAAPYAIYCAAKNVSVVSDNRNADVAAAPGFLPAFLYFDEYIAQIRHDLEILVPDEIRALYYNGLYVSVFSILELFLNDLLLCGIFSNELYYNNAIRKYNLSESDDQFEIENRIREEIMRIVFHQFDKVRKIYESILGIEFPDTKELDNMIHRRNNIVHRYAITNIDRMRVCDASCDDITHLIDVVVKFVEQMKSLVNIGGNDG
jgi:hypothetical protein